MKARPAALGQSAPTRSRIRTKPSSPGWGSGCARAAAVRGMSRKVLARESDISERYIAQLEGGEGNVSIILLAARRGRRRLPARGLDRRDAGGAPADFGVISALIRDASPEQVERIKTILTGTPQSEAGGRAPTGSPSSACAARENRRSARRRRSASNGRSSSSTRRSSARAASPFPRSSRSTGRKAIGASSRPASSRSSIARAR